MLSVSLLIFADGSPMRSLNCRIHTAPVPTPPTAARKGPSLSRIPTYEAMTPIQTIAPPYFLPLLTTKTDTRRSQPLHLRLSSGANWRSIFAPQKCPFHYFHWPSLSWFLLPFFYLTDWNQNSFLLLGGRPLMVTGNCSFTASSPLEDPNIVVITFPLPNTAPNPRTATCSLPTRSPPLPLPSALSGMDIMKRMLTASYSVLLHPCFPRFFSPDFPLGTKFSDYQTIPLLASKFRPPPSWPGST